MRILYIGPLSPGSTSRQRMRAMRRLGCALETLDTDPYMQAGGALAAKFRVRFLVGAAANALNRAVVQRAGARRFDLVWVDKGLLIRPRTVQRLRATGARVVHYVIDNPFGPRGDPGWRLFHASLADYDAHVVPRPASVADYRAAGAKRVILMPLAYDPEIHFPPPGGWSDAERPVAVGFVGFPHDDRAEFFTALWRRHDIEVRLRGPGWERALDASARAALHKGGPVLDGAYRQALWRTRINLGLITRSNLEPWAHRAFEIAGCGAFLLAERSAGHQACFEADREAVFFDGVDECAAMIRRYLPDQAARARIASAGRARATASGYGNDARLAETLREIAN